MKNKNEKGITLIALVITIVVLLILAGVAISMSINSDGLFGKAKEAAESWNTAVENESTEMQGLLDKLEIDPPGVVSVQGVSLDKTSITVTLGGTAVLTATVEPNEATNKNATWSSSDESKVTVDENGLVTGISEGTATITVTTENKNKTATCSVTVTLPDGWDSTKVANTVTETSTIEGVNKTRNAPIPVGFVASQIAGTTPENTIAGGLVIYQVPEGAIVDWTNSTITLSGEETAKNLKETVNQFVWIPVDDINQMVMCKSNASGSECNLDLENGVLKCTNTAHTANATNLCGRLYGKNTSSAPYRTSMNFSDRTQTWTGDSGYREPDIVSDYDTDDTTGGLTAFTTHMTNDFINMATSVEKYGGFYVSRYEVGENGASKKNQIVMTTGSSEDTSSVYVGVNNWYGLYNAIRTSSALDKTAVNPHMIYGCQYDQIINFIGAEAQKGHSSDEVVMYQSKTGTKPKDRLNNIYDLEGNNLELTAQASWTSSRVYRGGYYSWAKNLKFYPASHREGGGIPINTLSHYSSRTSLFL